MRCLFLAPFAPLFKLYFTSYFFLIFATPVVYALASSTGELDESIL